jgi:hypothetical protein
MLFFANFCSGNGFLLGLHLTLLTWSMFVLCIPANHGCYVLRLFSKMFRTRRTEGLALAVAFSYVIFSRVAIPKAFFLSIPTMLFCRIISNPNPYWLIIFVSVAGTFYLSIIRASLSLSTTKKQAAINFCVRALGVSTFFYFTYREIVILFSSAM